MHGDRALTACTCMELWACSPYKTREFLCTWPHAGRQRLVCRRRRKGRKVAYDAPVQGWSTVSVSSEGWRPNEFYVRGRCVTKMKMAVVYGGPHLRTVRKSTWAVHSIRRNTFTRVSSDTVVKVPVRHAVTSRKTRLKKALAKLVSMGVSKLWTPAGRRTLQICNEILNRSADLPLRRDLECLHRWAFPRCHASQWRVIARPGCFTVHDEESHVICSHRSIGKGGG